MSITKYFVEEKNKEIIKDCLFSRGFLFYENKTDFIPDYFILNYWSYYDLGAFSIYVHKNTTFYSLCKNSITFFLIGHAYNPFSMDYKESDILQSLHDTYISNKNSFYDVVDSLTGVFVLGIIEENNIKLLTDAAGMQTTYYGIINNQFIATSHAQLVAEIFDLSKSDYVKKLISYKYFKYFGTFLPGDISPYEELKRLIPNVEMEYSHCNNIHIKRIFPKTRIEEAKSEVEYEQLLADISDILKKNMSLISMKWPEKKAAISVTGGKDSTTTLACSKKHYDSFQYFSYIMDEGEKIDAYAAKNICSALNISHDIHNIYDYYIGKDLIELFSYIMEMNFGFIGIQKERDIKKRAYYYLNNFFETEVKSWVSEIGRARIYKRYLFKQIPNNFNARWFTALYKLFLNDRKLVKETDAVFGEFIRKYDYRIASTMLPWNDLYYWEFTFSSGEGLFLTSEHRMCFEVTSPYNNRKLLTLMLQTPLNKRIYDHLHYDIIQNEDKRINQTGVSIKDLNYSKKREIIERIILELNTRFKNL